MFPENQWLVQMYVLPIVSIVPFWGDMLFLGGVRKKTFPQVPALEKENCLVHR